jgi:DNA-binding transcriptional MocR family regulator
MSHLRASEIRELLKVTERPDVISLAGGLPAPEFFPTEELKAVTVSLLEDHGRRAMQYSTTEGYPPLRRWIAERMNRRLGTSVQPEEVLITSASQQGLDLTGKVFLDEGDEVLCESPTYLGAINAFRAYGVRFVEVPTDDDGMIATELEKILLAHDRVKLVYVVPDSQNPTGRTWSQARRRAFMELISLYRIPVVEDNPYSEVRFEGDLLPSLKSMDDLELVVYLSTFSKIFSPGMRVGWVAAPAAILEKYVLVKQGADLHTSTLAQMMLAAYLERYDLDANLARVREAYRARRDAMVRALEREMPPGVRFTRPSGGLFLWVELPDGLDSRRLLEACLAHDVVFVPGDSFFPNGGHANTLRLNYSAMPEDRIEEGIRRMGAALRELRSGGHDLGATREGRAAAG